MSEANGRVLVCPNCGSPVSADDVTCPVCGADLRGADLGSADLGGADLGGANPSGAGNDTTTAGASTPKPDAQPSGAPSSTTDSPDAEPTISVAASPDPTTSAGDKASGPATSPAVSAQDWRDYFQLLNGRAPTEAEFQRAVADGAVTSSDAGGAGAEQATTAQQATTPQQPPMGQQSVPAGAQQPVGTQQFAGQQQFVGQPTQMAGQPMAMTAPAQPAGDSAFVTSSKGYWQHLKQAWLHPMSVDVAVKDGYAWVTFGVILAVVVIMVTYTVPSVGNFFKALVLLGGFAMLLTVAAAALTRLLLNVRCTFTDMLKLGTQSVIPLIPLSILFLLNVLLMKSRVESAYSGAASDLWRMLNGSSSYDREDVLPFLRAGEFFLTVTAVLLVVLIIVVIMSAVVQSTYFYRLAAFTPGAQIERFGWLVALNTVMVVLMGIVIVRIWIN